MATTPLFNVPMDGSDSGQATAIDPSIAARVAGMGNIQSAAPNKYVETDGKHRGVAGVARDILGTLGDFLLTRLHMPAMYGPAQKDRQLQEAVSGFDQDPLAAINRVTSVDYNAGTKLRDQYTDNTRLQAQLDATKEARDARVAIAQEQEKNRRRGIAAAMLNSLPADDSAPDLYRRQRQQIALQYPDIANELPDTYDANAVNAFIGGQVPVSKQRADATARYGVDKRAEVSTDNNIRSISTSRENNIRSTDTSRDNNIRSTTTSNTNNVRTTDTSRDNNIRSTGTSSANNIRNNDRKPTPRAPRPQPTEADITYLRNNPGLRDRFDGKYGLGTAKKVLGN
jgi:hypothetical protein